MNLIHEKRFSQRISLNGCPNTWIYCMLDILAHWLWVSVKYFANGFWENFWDFFEFISELLKWKREIISCSILEMWSRFRWMSEPTWSNTFIVEIYSTLFETAIALRLSVTLISIFLVPYVHFWRMLETVVWAAWSNSCRILHRVSMAYLRV